jgi:hypothetical protein
MRYRFGDLTLDTNSSEFRRIMRSPAVQQVLAAEANRAKLRAQAYSGLDFASGVDVYGVNARGWVGASSVDHKRGRFNAGLHKRQVDALMRALHGV